MSKWMWAYVCVHIYIIYVCTLLLHVNLAGAILALPEAAARAST